MSELHQLDCFTRERRTLGGLIHLYEGNYVRLLRLAPDIDTLEGTSVSSVAGALDLYLTVLERARYTTHLLLSYRFHEAGAVVAEPNARVCVYHDVHAVELSGHCRRRRRHGPRAWRPGYTPELDRRWEMNRFLYRWLGFCTYQGHLFLRCTARPAAAHIEQRLGATGGL